MASAFDQRETIADLSREQGKAELIGGRIRRFAASGDLPSATAGEIAFSLHTHAHKTGHGKVYGGSIAYVVNELPSGRESFSPDASYYDGAPPANRMRFIKGFPRFAAEVRSENDYGPAAELEMSAKRADYFAAGTEVVWDVDPEAETVAVYRATDPTHRYFIAGT